MLALKSAWGVSEAHARSARRRYGELGIAPPLIFFFGALTIGRLVAGSVNVSARNFFRISAVLGLVGVALVMTNIEALCIIGVILGGLGFANVWPMLFSITVEERPERSSELFGPHVHGN